MKRERKHLFKTIKSTSLAIFFLIFVRPSFALNPPANPTESKQTKELKAVKNSTNTEENNHFKFINGCDINDQIRNQIIEIIEKNKYDFKANPKVAMDFSIELSKQGYTNKGLQIANQIINNSFKSFSFAAISKDYFNQKYFQ